MKLMHIKDPNTISVACEILGNGGLVVVPTDTVYGLSVDATNEKAVEKLLAFKSRVAGKPVSVFVESLDVAEKFVEMTKKQRAVLESMLPGAYTIVLNGKHVLSQKLEAEEGTLGFRIPDSEFVNALVAKFEKPITATSANQSGKSPHHSVEAFLNATPEYKKDMIDLVIDAGILPKNNPSTVVDFRDDEKKILRMGDRDIYVCSKKELDIIITKNVEETQAVAKKLLKKHLEIVKNKPLIFMLYGDMGAGKTAFVQGLGSYFGIARMTSPTFVIYYEYKVDIGDVRNLYHFDLYRIQDEKEFESLGIDEMLKPGNILCLEWSEKSGHIEKALKDNGHIIYVSLEGISENERKLTIEE